MIDVNEIEHFFNEFDCKTILDYGCSAAFPFPSHLKFKPGFDARNYGNVPCDMVVSAYFLDVMEDTELDSALSDVRRCTNKVAFLILECTDERDKNWWNNKLDKEFSNVSSKQLETIHGTQYFVCTP